MEQERYHVLGRGSASGTQVHDDEHEARLQMRRLADRATQSGRPFEVTLEGPRGTLCRIYGEGTVPERLRKA